MLTSLEKPSEGWGFDPGAPYEEGILIWDVKEDPASPKLLGRYGTGGTGTHRNFYNGGPYAYLSMNVPGYRRNILVIVDISDPARPKEVARWWWPGQHEADKETPLEGAWLHGPAYVLGNRAYLSYARAGVVILDVSDVRNPRFVNRISFGDLGSRLGCHSAVPIHGTNLLIANSEAIAERGRESLNYTFVIDVSDEQQPRILSAFPLPTPRPGLPYKNYYEKGGRFGPHNQHHFQGNPILFNPRKIIAMTYFCAGLRLYDISDPLVPREVGHFVPADPTERRGVLPTELVTQFEDVLVDARGYIYCTDKNYGLLSCATRDASNKPATFDIPREDHELHKEGGSLSAIRGIAPRH